MKRLKFKNYLKKELKKTAVKKAFDEEEIPAKIAILLAKVRKQKHLTQAQLAKKLQVPQQTVSKIEHLEHVNLTLFTLQKFANALGKELVIELK